MSKNQSQLLLINSLINQIKDMREELIRLKTNQLTRVILPKYNGSPSGVLDGEIWYDTSSNTFKKRQSGVTKNFETP